MGGFSSRHSRGEILTILPHAELGEAQQLLRNFGRGLQENVLEKLRDVTRQYMGTGCFVISVSAGLTEASITDQFDEIIDKARKEQQIVASVFCGDGGEGQ
jgi:hypothetical protein